uniref:Uncharacterized protein n=1 Tax=Octopus bimaculoides TaxID=37653 RepID=A0A0L8H8U4_OCTBM
MERKEEENNTKKNEEQENYQQPKENRKTESFTNSGQQVGESPTSLPGLDRKQSSLSQKNEFILKIHLGTSNSSNENPILDRMNSEEAERIPIRKARNTSMNKSVKGNYHVAIQRDRLDSYRFYKNRYESSESNAQTVRKHSESISNDYQIERSMSCQSNRHVSLSQTASSSFDDDVFVEGARLKRLESNISGTSTTSATSTTKILENPYNNLNYKIHSALWCPCLIFFYFCCCPGVYYMTNSDHLFRQDYPEKAKNSARIATVLYIVGIIFAFLFYSGLFALLIIFLA